MKPIKVPKTPKKAFNPNRRPSALLMGQVAHLEWAARPAAERKPEQMKKILTKGKPRTEAAAAERIAVLTRTVLQNAAADRERRLAETIPVVQHAPATQSSPSAARRRHTRSKATRRKRSR